MEEEKCLGGRPQPVPTHSYVTSVFLLPLHTECCFIKVKLELASVIRRKFVCFCCRIQKMLHFFFFLKVQLKYQQTSGGSYVFIFAPPVQPHFFVISLTLILSFLLACSPQEQGYQGDNFVSFVVARFEYPPNIRILNMNVQSLIISHLAWGHSSYYCNIIITTENKYNAN